MKIDLSIAISLASVVVALLLWQETRRMRLLTRKAFRLQSYEDVTRLPGVGVLGVVETEAGTRVRLIIFNMREMPLRVHCVKCYGQDIKRSGLLHWLLIGTGLRREFVQEPIFWNPKGDLDDEEHYADQTLPFTRVCEQEVLLVTVKDFHPYKHYRFEVITSQGTVTWEGQVPESHASLSIDYHNKIY